MKFGKYTIKKIPKNRRIFAVIRVKFAFPMPLSIVILAAGRGRRLRSARPKPLAQLAGRAIVLRVADAVRPLKPNTLAVVVAPDDPETPAILLADHADPSRPGRSSGPLPVPVFPVQKNPNGTGHAAAQALPHLPDSGAVLILCADAPLLQTGPLRKLVRDPQALSLLVFRPPDPAGYGRVVRDPQGGVADIAEERDANPQVRKIPEAFAGALCAPAAWLKKILPRIRPQRPGGEIYLTRLPALARADGVPVATVRCGADDALGVNSPADLARAEAALRRREAEKLLARGAQLADPLRLDIRGTVRPAPGVFVDANVLFIGKVTLGENARVGANCVLENCAVGKNAVVHPFSHLSGARVGAGCEVGPFARLRPGAVLGDGAKIGNFVEVKNASIGRGAKAGHLSYLGDAEVGAAANIGAGAVTCNFDGRKKSRTRIGRGAFIGSGTQLIAPVEVGAGAYVAAGSAVTRNVSPGALAFARARQTEKRRK